MTGRLEWIGIRPAPRGSVSIVASAELLVGRGVVGDHRATGRSSRRQVTLIQYEHLAWIADEMGLPEVLPELLRRNLVVSGIDLLECKNQTIHIGSVVLQGTGTCPPCGRMDEALGEGGRKTMMGRGGITARVLVSGLIQVGDRVYSPSLFACES